MRVFAKAIFVVLEIVSFKYQLSKQDKSNHMKECVNFRRTFPGEFICVKSTSSKYISVKSNKKWHYY